MKRVRIIIAILGLIIALGALIYYLFTIGSDEKVVNLAYKKAGKTYVFSKLGTNAVEMEIAQNRSPSVFPFLSILMDKEIYITPSNLQELSNLLAGSFQIHEYPEKSYDGYITIRPGTDHFQISTSNRSTEKVGEQELLTSIQLKNQRGERKDIQWSQIQMKSKLQAIENCTLKSFMIVTNPYPGETVGSKQKFVVVALKDLLAFFNPQLQTEYNKDQQMLYIIDP